MDRMMVKSKVGSDGVLHLELPLGIAEADKEVQVTVETTRPVMTQAEWADWVESMAGSWQGDFERPEQLPFEERDPL